MTPTTPDPARVARAYDVSLPFAGRDLVEIGCGTGRNTEWLAAEARTLTALDFSEGMLREARRRVTAPTVRFVQHDVRESWPLAADSADLVVATLVLEHIEALEPIFGEGARVLRPGGTFFCAELHPMRQLLGRQAEYTDPATGRLERVAAFLHDASDYVRAGLVAGLTLVELGEWRDDAAVRADPPRLISVRFVKP